MDEKIIIGVIAGMIILAGFLCSCTWTIIFYVGAIRLAILLFSLADFVKRHFLQKPLNLATRYGKGSWVFVTGAAGGIGFEFCKHFARLGFNIIALDRNEQGLINSKERLETLNPKSEVETIHCDLAKLTSVESAKEIIAKIRARDVSVLVNNAGVLCNA